MTTPNYSIYAIPAFWFLSFAPHIYHNALIQRGTNGRLDNVNPRGASFAELCKKSLDKATWGRVERARAAETNSFENLPLLVAAVICGNMAGLDSGTLNSVSSVFSFFLLGAGFEGGGFCFGMKYGEDAMFLFRGSDLLANGFLPLLFSPKGQKG